ncbi:DUF1985 domain-containing protein [Abeliophyllum distichum]|uniref:DUF1985 domain-containing protein n=1 Tax=Abeliophyllum distichum TaxID=126358 RepID=A0ABD1Q3D3_9LAMI
MTLYPHCDVGCLMFKGGCFQNPAFGHFLEVNEIVLNHQLIHQVLLREVKQPNVDEMWFNLSGTLVHFSLEEFCLITRLSDRDVVKFGILLLLTNLFFTTAYKRLVEDSLMVLVDSEDMNSYAMG